MNSIRIITLACLLFCFCCPATADILEFETGADQINFGTYSESGYTLTQSSFQVNIEDSGDGMLVFRTFTNGTPGALLTNDAGFLFDLLSLDVDSFGIVQTFQATASSGASYTFTGAGPVAFNTVGGDWTNLTSVNFQYSGSSSTEFIALDNINLASSIPEPGSSALIGLLTCFAFGARRFRKRVRS